MSIDTRADRSTALSQPTQPYHGTVETLDGLPHLARPATEFLPKTQWHGIHQVSASGLDHVIQLFCPGVDDTSEVLERRA